MFNHDLDHELNSLAVLYPEQFNKQDIMCLEDDALLNEIAIYATLLELPILFSIALLLKADWKIYLQGELAFMRDSQTQTVDTVQVNQFSMRYQPNLDKLYQILDDKSGLATNVEYNPEYFNYVCTEMLHRNLHRNKLLLPAEQCQGAQSYSSYFIQIKHFFSQQKKYLSNKKLKTLYHEHAILDRQTTELFHECSCLETNLANEQDNKLRLIGPIEFAANKAFLRHSRAEKRLNVARFFPGLNKDEVLQQLSEQERIETKNISDQEDEINQAKNNQKPVIQFFPDVKQECLIELHNEVIIKRKIVLSQLNETRLTHSKQYLSLSSEDQKLLKQSFRDIIKLNSINKGFQPGDMEYNERGLIKSKREIAEVEKLLTQFGISDTSLDKNLSQRSVSEQIKTLEFEIQLFNQEKKQLTEEVGALKEELEKIRKQTDSQQSINTTLRFYKDKTEQFNASAEILEKQFDDLFKEEQA